MPLATTTRSVRPSQLWLCSSLESILGYLQKNNVESAAKTLRLLADSQSIPRSTLVASQEESSGSKSPALSVATLGARIALDNNEIKTAVELAKVAHGYLDKSTQSISPTILHVISGLIEVSSSESLSYAAVLIESINPKLIPSDLLEKFSSASLDHPDLITKVWIHTQYHHAPRPGGEVLLALLKRLCQDQEFGSAIYLVTMIHKAHPSNAQSLPPEISIERAPQVVALASRAGASQQAFHLWNLARLQIGDPKVPATLEQAQFFGDPSMTYSLVRHFVKLAGKKPNELQEWHKAQLKGNPKLFTQNAERVYEAFATVHGFNQDGHDAYMKADHYHVSTSIACLFSLNRFVPAMDAINAFFRRNELPDEKDFGIILAALARRNAGRAIQILLEAAPSRIPGFTPTPYLYNIVLHHALLQDREKDALRVMHHARESGAGSLEPKSLDIVLRSAIKKIKQGWEENKEPGRTEEIRIERIHLFKRIIEVLNITQHHARPSTLRMAIQVALFVQRPITAWEIWMLAKKYRRLGTGRKGPDEKETKQQDFGPASSWMIAKGLWSTKEKGLIQEAQMWRMIEAMGIKIPEQAKQSGEWIESLDLKQEEHDLSEPTSLRRKPPHVT